MKLLLAKSSQMVGTRRLLSRFLHLPACLVLAAVAASATAQQVDESGIVTERLEPLAPRQGTANAEDDDGSGGRFTRAPFRRPYVPAAPEPIEPEDTAPRAGARIRQLDKMTGRIQTVEIAAGAEQEVDRLRVRIDACRASTDNGQHGAMAFVEIWDNKRADQRPVFAGWMFAESPELSAMDHPRYDVWVISCTTSAGEVSAGNK